MCQYDMFILNKDTNIKYQGPDITSINHFLHVLERDKNKVFYEEEMTRNSTIRLLLNEENNEGLRPEQFSIGFSHDLSEMVVTSADELGMVYGILHISETFLGVDKFWFWNDIEPVKRGRVEIHPINFVSEKHMCKYRGWFINDEVLLSKWTYQNSNTYVWEMIFEALLRCQGNMVIPGTDIEHSPYKKIASRMGLWITHHHAEPLGARMFSRVFPNKNPSYVENETLFKELWKEAILEQTTNKVIWNIGFRGQGDRPFWLDDPTFDTDKKRGQLISKIIMDQYKMINDIQENPICCVNLYGEITDLYKKGLLTLPEGVIKVWADNGYGKMVSRRQGNDNPRISSIPAHNDRGPHGIYYHITFYDLQASNHLTMFPNPIQFVNDELDNAFQHHMNEFLIVNCGNIRPHIMFLELLSQVWKSGRVDSTQFLKDYVSRAYPTNSDVMCNLINEYFNAIIKYGEEEDERAGEQFYHFAIRNITKQWIITQGDESATNLQWATGNISFEEQCTWFNKKVKNHLPSFETLLSNLTELIQKSTSLEKERLQDQLLLQVQIHKSGCQAVYYVTTAFEKFKIKHYFKAFLLVNAAIEELSKTVEKMENPLNEKWKRFYENDCLTNVTLTIYTLETLRKYIRMFGDGPNFYNWEKQYLTTAEERSVMLLTNKTKQLGDEALYQKLMNTCLSNREELEK
ncbi:glycosyl hydrolase 115 family protein [Metabacillus malikii]|uniref:Glycosyl hydrolase family 115 n=1 Tax=Metabacillus malikii TaxID=1504265 RepID=A0ABT9ZJR9_9BACI|nr:glycosyl hydrolase 115 family protein [Metabacillus malikii]MDQ0232531.1 hypothetical protein [Metabacillus malikii]